MLPIWWNKDEYIICALRRFDKRRKPAPPHLVSVVVGAHWITKNEASQRRHRVKRIIVHRRYLKQYPRYDIALLQLCDSIQYNRKVSPICVDNSRFPPCTRCMVTGWGDTTPESILTILHSRNYCNYRLNDQIFDIVKSLIKLLWSVIGLDDSLS